MAAPVEQIPSSDDEYADNTAQPEGEVDEEMHLNARDNRQVVADNGDIDKPGGELGQVPEICDDVLDEALDVLRQFKDSPEELNRIKEYITHYRDNYKLAELPDPHEGEVANPRPPDDPRVPHDDAPINQSHFEKIGNLIEHVQKFYDLKFESVPARQQVDVFLGRFCRKIRTIPGCLTATVEFCNESKLLELLKNLPCIAREIRQNIFHRDILFEKIRQAIKNDDFEMTVRKMIGLVVNKIRVQISVSLKDILLFLNNNKHSMNLVFQAKVVSLESQESKLTAERNTRFLQRLGKHEVFQNSLKVILAYTHGECDTSKWEETLSVDDKKKIVETEDSTKHALPSADERKSRRGPTTSSESASNTPSSHVSQGTATQTSSASLLSMAHGGMPVSQEPGIDQEPVLHFIKLPGSSMQHKYCIKYLGSLVAKVLPYGKMILEVDVSEDIQTDHRTGKTFRSGLCRLQSTDVCEVVMSKLKNEKSKAVGFENEPLIVSWALFGQL